MPLNIQFSVSTSVAQHPSIEVFPQAWVLKDYTSATLDLTSPDSYRECVARNIFGRVS
jgi:hypothetical protein